MRQQEMKQRLLWALIGATLLAGCAPTISNRGNILDPDKLATVQTGTSTREDVVKSLGTPTEVSTFDDKIWFYIGRQTEQYSFLDPEVLKQKAVEVKFDDRGVVTEVANLDLAEAHDVDLVARETPTYGHDSTLIQQLLGSLARPMPNMNQKQEGQ
jgi:outer membrane protein assembly factor BamE (lipoprotein component of BamABCDE complex)